MRYRFTAEDFLSLHDCQFKFASSFHSYVACPAWQAARKANALLERWEKESRKVYASEPMIWDERPVSHSHEAVLWNPIPCDTKSKGEI